MYTLNSIDFCKGTYRIRRPGTYTFSENVTFSPNPDLDFFPDPKDPDYSGPGFILGFFTALSIECDDVCVDLNGHTLEYSKIFALQQRYGSLIELSSSPFPPGFGPADFGPTITSARRCCIKNGTLGLVSHHSIHGNHNSNVIIEDLVCKDFEVAAISLNGCEHVKIERVKIGPNRQSIPVLGSYSHARFLLHLSKAYLNKYVLELTDEQFEQIQLCSNVLNKTLDHVKTEINVKGACSDDLFSNSCGLLDSNCYGICIFPKGIAVHDLTDTSYNQGECTNVTIKDVEIKNLKCCPTEIVGISEKMGDFVQFDLAGGVFNVLKCSDGNGYYSGNALSDLQIALAMPGFKFGNMTITKDVCDWANDSDKQLKDVFGTPNTSYRWRCGGDVMFHLTKGGIGLRVDGTKGLKMSNVRIDCVQNIGRMGNDTHNGAYHVSHSYQTRPLYHGCDAFGVVLSRVCEAKLKGLKVKGVHSNNGEASGVYLNSICSGVRMKKSLVRRISSGLERKKKIWYGQSWSGEIVKCTKKAPNAIPTASGIHLTSKDSEIELKDVRIEKLKGPRVKRMINC